MLLFFFPPAPGEDPVVVEPVEEFTTQPRWGWRRQTISGNWAPGRYRGGTAWSRQDISGSWVPKA